MFCGTEGLLCKSPVKFTCLVRTKCRARLFFFIPLLFEFIGKFSSVQTLYSFSSYFLRHWQREYEGTLCFTDFISLSDLYLSGYQIPFPPISLVPITGHNNHHHQLIIYFYTQKKKSTL